MNEAEHNGTVFEDHGPCRVSSRYGVTEAEGRIVIDSTGKVHITFTVAGGADGADLFRSSQEDGPAMPMVRFEAQGRLGLNYSTDSAVIRALSHKWDAEGTRLEAELGVGELKAQADAAPPTGPCTLFIQHLVPGLKCFGRPRAELPDGTITIAGTSKSEEPCLLSGVVQVEMPSVSPGDLDAKAGALDSHALRVLEFLSFAEGRWYSSVVRQEYRDGVLANLRARPGYCARKITTDVFHFLDLDPVVRLAAERYTDELRERTGLALAMPWMVMDLSYREAQFIGCMTALEHLTARYIDAHGSAAVVPSTLFKESVRPALHDCLASIDGLDEVSRTLLAESLGKLNQAKLSDQITAMLRGYRVPLLGIEDAVSRLGGIRNAIVHRARAPENRELLEELALVRELLTRVVLSLLEYQGPYSSCLRGGRSERFPPEA